MSRRPGRLTLVAAITISLAACAAPRASSWSFPPPASGDAASHEPGASHPPAAASESIEIEAFDLGFKPAKVTLPAAGTYAVTYEPYDATAPALLRGDVHDIDLVITEEEKTLATGFVQKVWTFGGTVPGPVIRAKVGDTIRIHLKNPAENQLAHSVDFHASQVAWNDEMTSINPGEEKLY